MNNWSLFWSQCIFRERLQKSEVTSIPHLLVLIQAYKTFLPVKLTSLMTTCVLLALGKLERLADLFSIEVRYQLLDFMVTSSFDCESLLGSVLIRYFIYETISVDTVEDG